MRTHFSSSKNEHWALTRRWCWKQTPKVGRAMPLFLRSWSQSKGFESQEGSTGRGLPQHHQQKATSPTFWRPKTLLPKDPWKNAPGRNKPEIALDHRVGNRDRRQCTCVHCGRPGWGAPGHAACQEVLGHWTGLTERRRRMFHWLPTRMLSV